VAVVVADTLVVDCNVCPEANAARNPAVVLRWGVADHLGETTTASLAQHHGRNCVHWDHRGTSRRATVEWNLDACSPRG